MIYWIVSTVVAVILIVFMVISLYKRKREVSRMTDEISDLKLNVGTLGRDKESLEKVSQFLRELIFFSQLGYEPTNDEKRKMIDHLVDSIKYISAMRSENSGFRTESALRDASKVQSCGQELSDVIESLLNFLSESLVHDKSLYPQMDDFIHYSGFDFCGKKQNPKSKIKEFGPVVRFGHVEE